MTSTIPQILDSIGSRILEADTPDGNEALRMSSYIQGLSDDVSISDLMEAGSEFSGMMKVMQDVGAIDDVEAMESAFMHGFVVAMEWVKVNAPDGV